MSFQKKGMGDNGAGKKGHGAGEKGHSAAPC